MPDVGLLSESIGRNVRAMFSGNRRTSSKVKMERAAKGHTQTHRTW
jgi:hypothetical protein